MVLGALWAAAWLGAASAARLGVNPLAMADDVGRAALGLRLSDTGMDWMEEVLGGLLFQMIPRIALPDVTQKLDGPGMPLDGKGVVHLHGMAIYDYKAPRYSSLKPDPPDALRWSFQDMDLGIRGHIQGQYVVLIPIPLSGVFEIRLRGWSFDVAVAMGQPTGEDGGLIGLRLKDCQADLRELDFEIFNGGLTGAVVNVLRNSVQQQMKPQLTQQICKQLEENFNRMISSQLANVPTAFPILTGDRLEGLSSLGALTGGLGRGGPPGQPPSGSTFDLLSMIEDRLGGQSSKRRDAPGRAGLKLADAVSIKQAGADFASDEGLWMRMELAKPPEVRGRYMELSPLGEVQWKEAGASQLLPTPFRPPRSAGLPPTSDAMLHVSASDFLLNSLLYHAYRKNIMALRMEGGGRGQAGAFLQTSCDGGFLSVCVGELLPAIADAYPDRALDLVLEPSQAPAVAFREGGVVRFDFDGVLFLLLPGKGVSPGKTILSSDMELKLDARMKLSEGVITGEAAVERLELKLRRSTLPAVGQADVEELAQLASGILSTTLNGVLSNGIPLPAMVGAGLRDPRVSFQDRQITLSTDLFLDKDRLRDIVFKLAENLDSSSFLG